MRVKKLELRRNKLIPVLISLFWANFITPALGENIKSNVSQSLTSAPITDEESVALAYH